MVMDFGATDHVCANKELFSTFAPAQVEETIYMANSTTAKVEGTGKVCLKMTFGKVLTLNNVFRDISDINAMKRMLESKFDMKDLRVADVILGIRIHRTPQGLALSQYHHIKNVLDKFKYMKFDIAKTPLDVSFALRKNEGKSDLQLEYAKIKPVKKQNDSGISWKIFLIGSNQWHQKMATESQIMDKTTSVGATNIAISSLTNASPTMAPAEKSKKFSGIDFKRWQQKIFFYLTTLCLQRFTSEDAPEELYSEWSPRQPLQCLSGTKTSKELWGALEQKFKTEDAGIKKFLVARFLDFKIIDSKSVVSQVQELQVITHDLLAEEDNKAAERRSKGNSTINGAHIVEDDQNNSKKKKKVEHENNQPKKKFKGKYFNCGKIGHKSTDCRAPKKGKKNDQANMIESDKEGDDLCAMFSECNLVGNPRE
ncbi:putative glucan endo-1,3-beta-glucosidase A-like [Capsicum annuum]|nr:putative glucan endo-1,3-beta-glucosidase A-like [Capsicum annuum]